jgi:oligopeptide transport system ATP-binding protein
VAAEVSDDAAPLVEVRAVSLTYGRSPRRLTGRLRPSTPNAPALRPTSLQLRAGECFGLVGESGSGKTTLGNCIAGLARPTTGEVWYRGVVVNSAHGRPRLTRARGVQVIFQSPYTSLNPRRKVGSVLAEILRVHKLRPREQVWARVLELLEEVGLAPEHADVRPGRLSGGQRQRVAIARALAFEPEVVVADEVVSALDASVQAQILNLLARLRDELNLTVLFISHDLAVVRQTCDRVGVMTRGELVEVGDVDEVLARPRHPYTRALLDAVPRLDAGATPSDG